MAQLQVAWTYRTGALPYDEELDKKAAFEATPILIDGKLFLSTPYDHVIALNAVSGVKIWEFDPKLEHPYGFSEVTSRGVSAWREPSAKAGKSLRTADFHRDTGRAADCAGWRYRQALRWISERTAKST